uniref:Uncharacterized protein n=1 Tax=Arion vulgaris TaxID=1028688 RepID=A0A0B6ZNM3_9EUPU
MSCLCGRQSLNEDDMPPILDVEKILTDYVWEMFIQTQSKIQRLCLRRNDFNVNVPMNYFHFETFRQHVTPRSKQELGQDGHILDQKNKNGNNAGNEKSRLAKSKYGKGASKNSNIIEISTDFVNDTDREQTYKFRLEKTRKAVLSVSFQKGFTVGGKARFSVELPKLVSGTQVSAETDMTINVTKQEGENVEETVVLETTSDIKVKERCKYVAKVVLAETRVSYDFAVWCRISMPIGGAPASITRKKDGEIYFTSTIKRLDKIFERFKSQVKIKTAPSEMETENYIVEIKTTGIVEGVRLSDQRIILESSDLHAPSIHNGVCDDDDDNEKVSSDKLMINVDYVPQTAVVQSYATPLLQRPRSIDGPIIEEVVEGDDDDSNQSGTSLPTVRIQSKSLVNRPSVSMSAIPTIVPKSPSSVGSSPLSEKSGSDGSVSNKTSTTV